MEVLAAIDPSMRPSRVSKWLRQAETALQARLDQQVHLEFVAPARVYPAPSMRGAGLVVVADGVAWFVDAGPKGVTINQVALADVRSLETSTRKISSVDVHFVNVVTADGTSTALTTQQDEPRAVAIEAGIRALLPDGGISLQPASLVRLSATGGKWWTDPLISWPGFLVVNYLGGFGSLGRPKDDLFLTLGQEGMALKTAPAALISLKFKLPWDQVAAIEVEAPEEVAQRVTFTRLLAVGVFALAWKKKKRSACVVIETIDGDEGILEVQKRDRNQARAHLSEVTAGLKRASDSSTIAREQLGPPTTTEQLERLSDLYRDGLLTADEFRSAKADLLGSGDGSTNR